MNNRLCCGVSTSVRINKLKIITGRLTTIFIFILFISANAFSQTATGLSEPNVPDNRKNDINIEGGNNLQRKKSDKNDSSIPETVKSNDIQDSAVDSNDVKKESGTNIETQPQGNTEKAETAVKNEGVNNLKYDPKSEKNNIKDTNTAQNADERKSKDDNPKSIDRKPNQVVNGLLDIRDADFKYSRIPGISLKKAAVEKEPENIQNNIFTDELTEPVVKKEKKEKSITGMEKGAADIFIKILLVCLIIGIIILLKFRSKSRNNKVVRRFPGA